MWPLGPPGASGGQAGLGTAGVPLLPDSGLLQAALLISLPQGGLITQALAAAQRRPCFPALGPIALQPCGVAGPTRGRSSEAWGPAGLHWCGAGRREDPGRCSLSRGGLGTPQGGQCSAMVQPRHAPTPARGKTQVSLLSWSPVCSRSPLPGFIDGAGQLPAQALEWADVGLFASSCPCLQSPQASWGWGLDGAGVLSGLGPHTQL